MVLLIHTFFFWPYTKQSLFTSCIYTSTASLFGCVFLSKAGHALPAASPKSLEFIRLAKHGRLLPCDRLTLFKGPSFRQLQTIHDMFLASWSIIGKLLLNATHPHTHPSDTCRLAGAGLSQVLGFYSKKHGVAALPSDTPHRFNKCCILSFTGW